MITASVAIGSRITNTAKYASYEKIVEVVSFYHCSLKLLTRQKGILIVPKEFTPTDEFDGLLFKIEHYVPVPNTSMYINEKVTGMLNEEVRSKIMRNDIVDGRVHIVYYIHVGAKQLSKLVKNQSYYVPEADMCVGLTTADLSGIEFPTACTHEASYETPPEFGYNGHLNVKFAYRTKSSVKRIGIETPVGRLIIPSKPGLNMKEGLYIAYGNSDEHAKYAYVDTIINDDTELKLKGIVSQLSLNNPERFDTTDLGTSEVNVLITKLNNLMKMTDNTVKCYSDVVPLQNELMHLVTLLADAKHLKDKEAIKEKLTTEMRSMDAATSSTVFKLITEVLKNI